MQDELRNEVLFLHNDIGITYTKIASIMGISKSYLCKFMKNERDMKEETYNNAVVRIARKAGNLH